MIEDAAYLSPLPPPISLVGEIGGLWKNVAGRYEMDGKKIYGKQILANPEEYFTEEVMQQLDEIARKEFSYGES